MIICFSDVKLYRHVASFSFPSILYSMQHLIGDQCIIENKSIGDKHAMQVSYNVWEERFNSICQNFRHYTTYHIVEVEKAVICHRLQFLHLCVK